MFVPVSASVDIGHLVLTDTLKVTAIIPLFALLEQHTVVHAADSCNKRDMGKVHVVNLF